MAWARMWVLGVSCGSPARAPPNPTYVPQLRIDPSAVAANLVADVVADVVGETFVHRNGLCLLRVSCQSLAGLAEVVWSSGVVRDCGHPEWNRQVLICVGPLHLGHLHVGSMPSPDLHVGAICTLEPYARWIPFRYF